MLDAVGIENEVELDGDAYAVRVDHSSQALALHHLWQYEKERGAPRPVEPEAQLHPQAWLGSVFFALLLLILPLAESEGWPRFDLRAIGVMDPVLIRDGEWWRAWTALSLHWDAPHLLGNLLGGCLLGYSAAQIWGNARAWALILLSAGAANLLEAAMGSAPYVSAGASTAVFAALGLIAAWSWRTRRRYAHNWRRRLVPLVAGIAVLAMLGAGESDPMSEGNTNVLSHALGFAMGALTGIAVASEIGGRWLAAMPSWMVAIVAVGQVPIAWMLTLLIN